MVRASRTPNFQLDCLRTQDLIQPGVPRAAHRVLVGVVHPRGCGEVRVTAREMSRRIPGFRVRVACPWGVRWGWRVLEALKMAPLKN